MLFFGPFHILSISFPCWLIRCLILFWLSWFVLGPGYTWKAKSFWTVFTLANQVDQRRTSKNDRKKGPSKPVEHALVLHEVRSTANQPVAWMPAGPISICWYVLHSVALMPVVVFAGKASPVLSSSRASPRIFARQVKAIFMLGLTAKDLVLFTVFDRHPCFSELKNYAIPNWANKSDWIRGAISSHWQYTYLISISCHHIII